MPVSSDTEVGYLYAPLFTEQDVLWLEISVDNASIMNSLHSGSHLTEQSNNLWYRQALGLPKLLG